MPTRTDEELLLAAGRGDREAFGHLVKRHHRAIIHFAHRFLATADRATAEDLAQQVFLGAWKYAPNFQPRAKVLTWLFRIATNTCLNYRRSEGLRLTLPLDDQPGAEPEGRAGETADTLAETHERAQQVRAAVANLPPNQRAAILLRHFHEFSYTQIAEIMGTSVSAIDSLLHRARDVLRQELAERKSENSPQDSSLRHAKPL
jgi:RNA polymerase sigma-70 factor (ECF subfamily)